MYIRKSTCTCNILYGYFISIGRIRIEINPQLCRSKEKHPGRLGNNSYLKVYLNRGV